MCLKEPHYRVLNSCNTTLLTWILCKDSSEGSSQSHVGSNFIVLFFLKCNLEHFKPNFMNLVPGVFEIRITYKAYATFMPNDVTSSQIIENFERKTTSFHLNSIINFCKFVLVFLRKKCSCGKISVIVSKYRAFNLREIILYRL